MSPVFAGILNRLVNMKYTLTLIVIIFFAAIGCKKKVNVTHCYICNRYSLVHSPGYPQYDKPRTLVAIDTVCNQDDQTIQVYMKTHIHDDTIYKSESPNPGLVILNQYSSICDRQ